MDTETKMERSTDASFGGDLHEAVHLRPSTTELESMGYPKRRLAPWRNMGPKRCSMRKQWAGGRLTPSERPSRFSRSCFPASFASTCLVTVLCFNC